MSVAKLLFDPGETAKKGADNIKEIDKQLKESKNRLANYQNEIQQIDTNSAEVAKTKREQAANEAKKLEDEKTQKYIEDIKKKADQAAYEKQVEADAIAELAAQDQQAKDDANDRLRTATRIDLEIAEANYEANKKISEAKKKLKEDELVAYAGLSNDLADILGRETAAGKALAIASATIDTYSAANKALDANYGIFGPAAQIARFIAVTATIARGIKNVKAIASVKTPKGGGGGAPSLPGGGGGSGGSALPTQAPIGAAVQVTNTQTLVTPSIAFNGSCISFTFD